MAWSNDPNKTKLGLRKVSPKTYYVLGAFLVITVLVLVPIYYSYKETILDSAQPIAIGIVSRNHDEFIKRAVLWTPEQRRARLPTLVTTIEDDEQWSDLTLFGVDYTVDLISEDTYEVVVLVPDKEPMRVTQTFTPAFFTD